MLIERTKTRQVKSMYTTNTIAAEIELMIINIIAISALSWLFSRGKIIIFGGAHSIIRLRWLAEVSSQLVLQALALLRWLPLCFLLFLIMATKILLLFYGWVIGFRNNLLNCLFLIAHILDLIILIRIFIFSLLIIIRQEIILHFK